MQTEYVWIDSLNNMVNHDHVRHQRDAQGCLSPNGLMPEQLVELGYQEIAVTTKPDDYSDKLYYRHEQTTAPYIVYTRKPDEMIAQMLADEIEVKKKQVRNMRELILNRLVGIAFAAKDDNDSATVKACKDARVELLSITTGWPTNPDEVDGFVLNKWRTIAENAAAQSLNVLGAFNGVDL